MGPTLRKRLNKILLCTALFVGLVFQGVYGQSLPTGSIAFTGFNGDGEDDFAIVTLVDLPADTEISFTDKELTTEGSVAGTGDTFTWNSGTSEIPAGTVITFNDVSTGDRTVSVGSYTSGSAISIKVTGAVIFAFQGTEEDPSFLASIATDSGMYDALGNTDLEEDSTAILLSYSTDVAEFTGDRNGNTLRGYLSELNDTDNWQEESGTDDQSGLILPFDDTPFTIVDAPTVAFTASSIDSTEGETAKLTVELVESTGTEVKADIIFNEEASTATSSDIGGFTNTTITFTGSPDHGETKKIDIQLNDDNSIEGKKEAVFQIQNVRESLAIGGDSPGTAISPDVLTLNITDNDAPEIVINEIHADPDGTSGDADGNGEVNIKDDEFVELVNKQSTDVDISGWTVSDEDGLRHTFPDGTTIPANGALVLFGDKEVSPSGSFGGAIVQSNNETQTLHLNNDGDTVELADSDGNIIASVSYGGEGGDDQSITLDPDNPGNYIKHSEAAGADGALFSPGTKVDGTPFGSNHAIAFRGTEGWRMISSPVENATFEDFFGDLWMQGLSGSNDENGDGTIFSWNESDGAFEIPGSGSMDDPIEPGKGYIVYVFEDDEYNTPGIQGGFPKVINSDGTQNSEVSNVSVSANDEENDGIDGNEGWNMLGNPFNTDIIASEVINVLEGVDQDAVVNSNIYVWDHDAGNGNGDWVTLSGDETIAPFQGFFVRYETEINGEVTFTKDDLEANKGAEFYKENREDVITFDLQLHGEQYHDTYSLEFSENGTTELDRYDAYKLFSLNPNAISLFSTLSDNRLQKNALPKDLESNLEIPLSFDANGRSSLTFRWDNSMEELPTEWDLILIDNEQNREIDLRRNEEYSFNVNAEQSNNSQSASGKKGLLNKAEVTQDSRFILSVQPNIQGEVSSDLPESVKLKPNYPNPFNPTTTIPFELNEDADVLLTVWNMIGQKVETLIDGTREAGTHEVTWNASNMPSGMYIARFEVNGTVFTRKMTLIK